MWILLLIAVHINDPRDIPARVQISFENQAACEQARTDFTYWIKFNNFKVVAECKRKS